MKGIKLIFLNKDNRTIGDKAHELSFMNQLKYLEHRYDKKSVKED